MSCISSIYQAGQLVILYQLVTPASMHIYMINGFLEWRSYKKAALLWIPELGYCVCEKLTDGLARTLDALFDCQKFSQFTRSAGFCLHFSSNPWSSENLFGLVAEVMIANEADAEAAGKTIAKRAHFSDKEDRFVSTRLDWPLCALGCLLYWLLYSCPFWIDLCSCLICIL